MNRNHAHPQTPAPSNLRRGPLPEPYEWMRADPGYDVLGTSSHDVIGALIRLIPAAVVVVAGLWAFMALVIAVLAPVPAQ